MCEVLVYAILYINTDEPENSEVLGIYTDYDYCVDKLLERANYRNKNGMLTQYLRPTEEYENFKVLREKVYEEGELFDEDIYRIEEIILKI